MYAIRIFLPKRCILLFPILMYFLLNCSLFVLLCICAYKHIYFGIKTIFYFISLYYIRHDGNGKYFFNILLDFYQCTSVISSHLKENTAVDFEEKFIQ